MEINKNENKKINQQKLDTKKLEKILFKTKLDAIEKIIEENEINLIDSEKGFVEYIREMFKLKNIKEREVLYLADVSEKYGYKLLSCEKRTRQRDIILRICYVGNLNLMETQKALKLYEMPQLYAKFKRDALIMIAFNERPGDILDVNQFLIKNNVMPLKTSGVQD